MRPNDGIEEIGISLDGIIGLEEKTGRDSGILEPTTRTCCIFPSPIYEEKHFPGDHAYG